MKELSITLDPESPRPLYEQIYLHIREEIRRGNLKKGEKLPSTRALSGFLSVSRCTVDTAYDQLLSEGYISAKRGSGYLIAASDELYDLKERPAAKKGEESAPKTEEGWIDFSPRMVDLTHFPYATFKKISRENLVDANQEMFSLGEANGDLSLRKTIAGYLYASRGLSADPENLVIGAGNDYLLMLLRTLLEEKKTRTIGMEFVTYQRPAGTFRSFGWNVVPISMDGNGMMVSSLKENHCSLAYVMPAHQYPSGITMPITRRQELLSWAKEEEGRYIIEDDYDSEFRYRGRPIPSLGERDGSGKVIYIGTFSKSIAPAIRMSYMLLPPGLSLKYHKDLGFLSSTVSRIDQQLLTRFIGEGYFERYLNRMRTLYRGKRDVLLEALKPLRENFEVRGENAGLHLLLEWKGGTYTSARQIREMESELVKRAAKEKTKVYPMSENLLREEGLPRGQEAKVTILLGYAKNSPEEIREGIARLCKAWRGIEKDPLFLH